MSYRAVPLSVAEAAPCLAEGAFWPASSCALALTATSPCLLRLRPPAEALGALQLACAMGALFAVSRAARRGDRLARGGLNPWEEAAAFWAVLMLLHCWHRHGVSARRDQQRRL